MTTEPRRSHPMVKKQLDVWVEIENVMSTVPARGVCLCQAGEWTAAAAKQTEMVDLEDPGDPAWLRSQRYTLQGHISFDREELDEALATLTE